MRERIDISEVEAQTKIRAKYLRAIENEEWDLLPGPVYAKSFLRTYSDYLGLDSRSLIDEFKRHYERPSEHESRAMGRVAARDRNRDRDRRPGRRGVPSWVPILVAVLVIVGILYVVGRNTSGSSNTTAGKPPAHHHVRKHVTRTHTAKPAAPRKVTLQLVPTGAIYVCLVNGHGTKLINEQTFSAGQTIPSATAHRLLLTLGNAAVTMKVNGRPVPVAPSATPIRLLIAPAAHGYAVKHIPLTQTPTCP